MPNAFRPLGPAIKFSALLFSTCLTPALGLAWVNPSFETGTLTGWTTATGSGGGLACGNPTASIVNVGGGPAPDSVGPLTPAGLPSVKPGNGSYAVQVFSSRGDPHFGDWSQAWQSDTVPSGGTSCCLSFDVAAILEDYHYTQQQDTFGDAYVEADVVVGGGTGGAGGVTVASFRYGWGYDVGTGLLQPTGQNGPGTYPSCAISQTPYPNWGFIPWTQQTVNLCAYAGQQVTLLITAFDCDGDGHYSLGYLDNVTWGTCVPPQFTLVKSVAPAGDANPGDTLTYSLTYSNPSGVPIDGVQICDTIPTDVKLLSDTIAENPPIGAVTWTGTGSGNLLCWDLDYVGPHVSGTLSFAVSVQKPCNTIINQAEETDAETAGLVSNAVTNEVASCTPTKTPKTTPTWTLSPTLSPTWTLSPTLTRTWTPSPTVTPTRTPTKTPSPTSTSSPSVTRTPTTTPSATGTPTATSTPTFSQTRTSSPTSTSTPSATNSPTRTPTASATVTPSPTSTSSPSATATATSIWTATPTATVTSTSSPSVTATVTWTPTPTASPTPTPTKALALPPTSTPSLTSTSSPSVTVSWTPSPTPTVTVTVTPTRTFTPSPTDTASPTATVTGTSSPTDAPTSSPTPTATWTWTPSPTVTATPAPTGPFMVIVGIYNEAGELILQVRVEKAASAAEVLTLSEQAITSLSRPLTITDGVAAPAVWDGRGQDGQPVSNGQYYVKVDSADAAGNVNSVTQPVLVELSLERLILDVYDEAGELVRQLLSTTQDADGASAHALLLSADVLVPGPGAGVAISADGKPLGFWDGSAANGTFVTSGTYFITLHELDGKGGETNVTLSLAVLEPESPGLQIRACPNQVTDAGGTVFKVFAGRPLTLRATIYDLAGEKVEALQGAPGANEVAWSAPRVASGLYLALVECRDASGLLATRQKIQVLVVH